MFKLWQRIKPSAPFAKALLERYNAVFADKGFIFGIRPTQRQFDLAHQTVYDIQWADGTTTSHYAEDIEPLGGR